MNGDSILSEVNITLIVTIIGNLTALIVAGIGFVAALKAAKIASDRETTRVFAVKRHEAIIETIKILQNRVTILKQIILISELRGDGLEVVDQVQLVLSLAQRLDQSLSSNQELFGVLPYISRCPVFNIDEQYDVSRVLSFVRICKEVSASMKLRSTGVSSNEELLRLKKGLEGIREPMNHEYEKAKELVDYLCDQLKDDTRRSFVQNVRSKGQSN